MKSIALCMLLAVPAIAAPQDPAALEAVLKRGSEAERIEAIEATAGSGDAKIAAAVAKALGDPSQAVAVAAAAGLGRMTGAASLQQLHQAVAAAAVRKDEDRLAAVFRAIGRRADPTSVDVLAAKPEVPSSYPVIRARIYGLGNIRTTESVAALVGMTDLDSRSRTETTVFADDLRTVLIVLTGADRGTSNFEWNEWWRGRRTSFEVAAAERPWIPEIQRLRWQGFWGEPYVAGAERPRDRRLPDGTVIADVARSLESSDPAVLEAAVEFLGRSDDEQAVPLLRRAADLDAVRQHPDVFAATMRAIGRRADPSCVDVLKNRPFSVKSYQAIRARLYGLARIGTSEAVGAIVAMAQLATPAQGEGFVFMEDVRVALCSATGVDQGISKIGWDAWWRANQGGFQKLDPAPWIPRLHQLRWEEFWGEPFPIAKPGLAGLPGMSQEQAIGALGGADRQQRIDALRVLERQSDRASLDALHRAAGDKSVQRDPALLARVFQAIGRRGEPASVGVLGDKPLSSTSVEVIRARIFGLANIRTRESVAALIRAMKLASPPRGEPFVFAEDLRTALVVLTGVDHGPWKTRWDQWWRAHEKSFQPTAERPPIEPLLELRWEAFWGEPYAT